MSMIDKHFVSDIDAKMAEFDETHAKSASQKAEYEKYQRIYQRRDTPTDVDTSKEDLWK